MKRSAVYATFFVYALSVALWTTTAPAQQVPEGAVVLERFDEKTLSKDFIVFQRGVFRIDDAGKQVTMLCIPVEGKWKEVGSMRDCGSPPPPDRQREISRFVPDVTFIGIRNLGIATEQWDTVQKQAESGKSENLMSKVGQAFSLTVGPGSVRWRFDSKKLPQELKTPIPGSGFQVHFGGLFSDNRKLSLFDKDGDLAVETRLSMPTFVRTGKAHSGISVNVDLEMPTVGGRPVNVPTILSLFHPNPSGREAIRSDGRVDFVSSHFGPGKKYVQTVEGHEQSSPWRNFERFTFKITRENAARIMADANVRRKEAGEKLFDEARLDQIKVLGVTLRNESRFLDEGDVTMEVAVDYVRLLRMK